MPEGKTGKEGKGFHACYLLTSLSPRFKGHTYIGYTVNPRRRIRQHNGEIRCGAWRTKKRRPWEMVLCLYGFPTNVSALQFEWAWQHPTESIAVRQAAATFKSFSGVANKIKLAYTMLNLPAWQSLNITVNYFSTHYMKYSAGCPSLPEHMKVEVCPMDELPCYTETYESLDEEGDAKEGWDDEEEYEHASNKNRSLMVNTFEVEARSVDEFPCYNAREKSSFELGDGKANEEEYNEAINTSETAKDKHPNLVDQFGWFEEYGWKEQRDRSPHEVDNVQQFGFNNSPVKSASSGVTRFCTTENRDGYMMTLFNDNVSELDGPSGKRFTSEVAAERGQQANPTFPHDTEVIDLSSPSPGFGIGSCSKKRRVCIGCPEVIDLTLSPTVVQ